MQQLRGWVHWNGCLVHLKLFIELPLNCCLWKSHNAIERIYWDSGRNCIVVNGCFRDEYEGRGHWHRIDPQQENIVIFRSRLFASIKRFRWWTHLSLVWINNSCETFINMNFHNFSFGFSSFSISLRSFLSSARLSSLWNDVGRKERMGWDGKGGGHYGETIESFL